MEAGRSIVVLNPYDWLPGHGENGLNLYKTELNWFVEVEYEGEVGLMAKTFQFSKVCSLFQCSMPGADLPDVHYGTQAVSSIGSLLEYPDSEAAKAWESHFSRTHRIVKHYSIVFLAENLRLVVFAESVTLSDGFYERHAYL